MIMNGIVDENCRYNCVPLQVSQVAINQRSSCGSVRSGLPHPAANANYAIGDPVTSFASKCGALGSSIQSPMYLGVWWRLPNQIIPTDSAITRPIRSHIVLRGCITTTRSQRTNHYQIAIMCSCCVLLSSANGDDERKYR